MTTHRTILIAAAVLAMFVAPAFAQTQPPNSPLPGNSGTLVCHYSDGQISTQRLRPDFATTDTGVATEGHDTLAEGRQCLQPLQSTLTATPAATWTPEPRVPEPTVPAGPLPDCSPDQPQGTACGGKG